MNKEALKKMLVGTGVMIVVSMVSLLVLSALTFILKWQAPKAQVGLTLTYIVSGLIGGWIRAYLEKREVQNGLVKKLREGFTLGTSYMVLLLVISIVISGNGQWDIGQIMLIWILISCSSVLGIQLHHSIMSVSKRNV